MSTDPRDFTPTLAPVTLGVLSSKLSAIAVEMSYTLRRTSRSLYVKEGGDFSASVLGLDGQLIAVPEGAGSPMFTILDCMPAIRAVPDLAPGDVIITNDPYSTEGTATHLPDVQMIQPYFHGDRLVGYGWAFIHSSDIGGRVPSSISPFNTEIYQDGLQIPPVRYARGGVVNPEIEAIIRRNNRTPDANSSDFRAMMSALELGQRRVSEIIDKFGVDAWLAAQEDIPAYSASRAATVLASLTPAVYRFEDYLDNDGITPYPVRYRIVLTVHPEGRLTFDFTGTDPQILSAFNIASAGKPHPMLLTRYLGLVITLDPTIPLNGGLVRPIEVIAPYGSVVNAARPAAVGVRHASAVRINDMLAGVFAAASPETQAAAGSGLVVPVVVSERHGVERTSKVINSLKGGFGGAFGLDGLDGKDNGYISGVSTPVEYGESEIDVTVLRYALRPDSGGAGQWRGGVGRELVFRIDADGSNVLARGLERFVFRPWGVAGGKPGAPSELIVNEGRSDERRYQKIDMLELERGDTVTVRVPGGGGFGDPLQRDPDAVLTDVRQGLVSAENARADYGVAVVETEGGLAVDAAETAALRAAAPPRTTHDEGGRVAYDVGEERRAWEEVFPSGWYERFVAALFALPAGERTARRAHLFDRVLAVLPAGFPLPAGEAEEREAAAVLAARLLDELEDEVARRGDA